MVTQEFDRDAIRPQLEEPHFADEQTLISARRVVPLRKVQWRWSSGGGLVAAFALALALGAATALLLVRLPGKNSVRSEVAAVNAEEPPEVPSKAGEAPETDEIAGGSLPVNSDEIESEASPLDEIKAEDPPKPVLAHKKSTIVVTP